MIKFTRISLLIILIWFIWTFNLKPLWINKEINFALALAEKESCDQSLQIMDDLLKEKSFLDNYIRLKYVEITSQCLEQKKSDQAKELIEKTIKALEEATVSRPYYTRAWMLLGKYNLILMENWSEDRIEQARNALTKALELSPKRQETIVELARADILAKEYEAAREKANACLEIDSSLGDCYWLAGLSNIYLDNLEESDKYLTQASQKGYPTKTKDSWLALIKAYIKIESYPHLAKAYPALIKLDPNNPQYYASLAFVYQKLGQIEEAKKQALKIIELFPEHRQEAEAFIENL